MAIAAPGGFSEQTKHALCLGLTPSPGFSKLQKTRSPIPPPPHNPTQPTHAANAAREETIGAAQEGRARAGQAFEGVKGKAENAADKGREVAEGAKERGASMGESVKVGLGLGWFIFWGGCSWVWVWVSGWLVGSDSVSLPFPGLAHQTQPHTSSPTQQRILVT